MTKNGMKLDNGFTPIEPDTLASLVSRTEGLFAQANPAALRMLDSILTTESLVAAIEQGCLITESLLKFDLESPQPADDSDLEQRSGYWVGETAATDDQSGLRRAFVLQSLLKHYSDEFPNIAGNALGALAILTASSTESAYLRGDYDPEMIAKSLVETIC